MINTNQLKNRQIANCDKIHLSVYHCSLKGNASKYIKDFIDKLIEASSQNLRDVGIEEIKVKTFSPTEHKDQCKPNEGTYWPKEFTLITVNNEITDVVYGARENIKSIIWLSAPIYDEIATFCADDEIEACSMRSLGENDDFSRETRKAIEELFLQIGIMFDEKVDEIFKKEIHVLLKNLDPKYDPSVIDITRKRLR